MPWAARSSSRAKKAGAQRLLSHFPPQFERLSQGLLPQVLIERLMRVLDRSVPSAPVQRHSSKVSAMLETPTLILIIDDDASVCELMERNLDQEGFHARAAHSGEEGLRMAKQLHPSAIILDVVMPGLDGWGVLAALRSDTGTAEIPIIMVSMLDERERGLRMGADEATMKPFGRDRSRPDLLHKYLGNQAGKRDYSSWRMMSMHVRGSASVTARPELGGLRNRRWH